MKVLVTGAEGMLAKDLIPCLTQRGHQVLAPREDRLDVTDLGVVRDTARTLQPDLIVNCAAYTDVDAAEETEYEASLVNGLAVQNLCLICQDRDIPLVHFSTDYVFDGMKNGPYAIHDATNPINAYGRSKLLGEQYVQWLLDRFYLIRTSWLFGLHGGNFVETMLDIGGKQKQVSVVDDQKGCPTWTQHLAQAAASIVETARYGVYHVTNSEPTTWFEFAKEIFRLSDVTIEVLPVTTDQFPRPARRPRNSVLDPFPLAQVLGRDMPSWRQALEEYLSLRKEKVER